MNKTVKRVLTVVIILVVIAIIFYPKMDFLKSEPEPVEGSRGRGGGASTLTVNAIIINPGKLENKISVTGEVIPNESVNIQSEIAGKVETIYFKEGEFVKKGKILVKINVDELNAQREKILYTQELRKDLEFRQRQLLEREAISQEEYDQALNELQTAQADLKLVETQISKSEIRAPFDGIIGLRQISVGSFITSNDIISSLYSINPIKVEFAIPGRYSNRVKVGSSISFKVDAVDTQYTGEVYAIEPRLNPNTRTLTMRAVCSNQGNSLLPGQFARVEFLLDKKEEAIMVPTEAAVPELDGIKVFLSKNGKVVPQYVETGIRTDTQLEILSGLEAADTVLTSGILQVRPGMDINVTIN